MTARTAHPGDRRRRHAPDRAGAVRLRRRERPGPLPVRRRHRHRGRPELRWGHARRRRRPHPLQALQEVVDPGAGRSLDRGLGSHMVAHHQRPAPDGWTSADAAGLPIPPGLLRWNEVCNGYVDRAIRFPTSTTSRRHVWARTSRRRRHRLARLPADGRALPPQAQVLDDRLRPRREGRDRGGEALRPRPRRQRLAVVFQGEQNAACPDRLVKDLQRIPSSAFVAVATRSLKVSNASARSH